MYPNFFSQGKTKLQNYMTFLKVYTRFRFALAREEKANYATTCLFRMCTQIWEKKANSNYTTTWTFRKYISDFFSGQRRKEETTQLHALFGCTYPIFFRPGQTGKVKLHNYMALSKAYINFFFREEKAIYTTA